MTETHEIEPVANAEIQRPIALLSLPNTGTDWLVNLLLRQNPCLRYFREFFNPVCNPTYENELNRAFGCEMVDNYSLMTKDRCPHDDVFEKTWAKENYNFTKENYSSFKLDWFVGKFDCFVLYRRAEMTLPGGRLQVKTWYDAMYGALLRNKWTLSADLRVLVDFAVAEADTMAKRQVAAFIIFYYKLLKDAYRLGVPVIDYERLMFLPREEMADYLSGLPSVADAEKLAGDLCEDRRPGQKDFASLKADEFFQQLVGLALRSGGEGVAVLAPGQEPTSSFECERDFNATQSSIAVAG